MDPELSEKLKELLNNDMLEEAISAAENKLRLHSTTEFNKILGRNLLNLANDLADYINEFYTRINFRMPVKAIYCEMNGFTINTDCWFLTLFAFDKFGGTEDYDWLADWKIENYCEEGFVIQGYEDVQSVYENYLTTEKWKDQIQCDANEICALLVILRVQELLKATLKAGQQKGQHWTSITVLVTAHDYDDFIYQVR